MPAKKRRPIGWPTFLAIVVAIAVYRWVADHLILVLLLTALVLAALLVVHLRFRPLLRTRRLRHRTAVDPHRMSPGQFEEFLANLCLRDGCRQVKVVGGANDHGADVLYVDPHGRRGLIQAKRYAPGNGVGNEHVQIVNGTYRDFHGAAHASIVTTSHFTQPAQQFAKRVGIRLVDDHRLDDWIRGYAYAAPWN